MKKDLVKILKSKLLDKILFSEILLLFMIVAIFAEN